MELNSGAILDELDEFEKHNQDISRVLEEYLQSIARTGKILHPWNKLKPLLKRKMELVITDFCKTCPPDTIPSYPNTDNFDYERLKANLLEAVEFFPNAPFTIQRLCELITDPNKHYNRTDKYMRGLVKNLLVVSTIEPTETDGVSDRDPSAVNDWVNSDSSNEAHNFAEANPSVPTPTPAVNGTVLENFATVFPTAPRIGNKPSTIPVSSDQTSFQHTEPVSNIEYEVVDSTDLEDYEETPSVSSEAEGVKIEISSVVSISEPPEATVQDKEIKHEKEEEQVVSSEPTSPPLQTEDLPETREAEAADTTIEKEPESDEDGPSEKPEDNSITTNGTFENEAESLKEICVELIADKTDNLHLIHEAVEEMKDKVSSLEGNNLAQPLSDICNDANVDGSDVQDLIEEPDYQPNPKRQKFDNSDSPNNDPDSMSLSLSSNDCSMEITSSEITLSFNSTGDTLDTDINLDKPDLVCSDNELKQDSDESVITSTCPET